MSSNEIYEFQEDTASAIALKYIDFAFRLFALLSYLIYFTILIIVKNFQSRTILYLHHLNFVGLVYSLQVMLYIYYSHPQFANTNANNVLCILSEILWGLVRYLRPLSFLLLAAYRLANVFKPRVFYLITKSNTYVSLPIGLAWVLATLMFIIKKFSFKTGVTYYNCVDSFSTSVSTNVSNAIIDIVLSIFLPSIISLVIIFILYHKIRVDLVKVTPTRLITDMDGNQVVVIDEDLPNLYRTELISEKALNEQLLLLYVCFFIIQVSSVALYFKYMVSNFYYYRQIFRIFSIIFHFFIPVVSLAYYQNMILKHIFNLNIDT
jgi:hypothetical protein